MEIYRCVKDYKQLLSHNNKIIETQKTHIILSTLLMFFSNGLLKMSEEFKN